MFRAIISPISRSTRLCVTACGKMQPRFCQPVGYRLATSWVHYTTNCNAQSSAPEDGQNDCPKHVELIGIINKPLLLLVASSWLSTLFISMMHGQANIKFQWLLTEEGCIYPVGKFGPPTAMGRLLLPYQSQV